MGTFLKFLERREKDVENSITKNGITVTVSGLSGVGKGTVAEAIAQALGLRKIAMGDVFRKIAKERNLELEKFSAVREAEIDYDLEITALECAMAGGVVLDGRMTGLAAGDYADCRILLECGMEDKSVRVAKREKITVDEARKKLMERDAADSAKYVKLYGSDGSDRAIYDVVIETSNMDMETTQREAVKIVRQVLKDKGL